MVLHCACNLPGGLSMLSFTTTPLSYHHFPIFAFDHSIGFLPFCTHFAPFCTVVHRFAPFCTVLPVLPVLQGPGGEWVSVVAVSLHACSFCPRGMALFRAGPPGP